MHRRCKSEAFAPKVHSNDKAKQSKHFVLTKLIKSFVVTFNSFTNLTKQSEQIEDLYVLDLYLQTQIEDLYRICTGFERSVLQIF